MAKGRSMSVVSDLDSFASQITAALTQLCPVPRIVLPHVLIPVLSSCSNDVYPSALNAYFSSKSLPSNVSSTGEITYRSLRIKESPTNRIMHYSPEQSEAGGRFS